MALEPAGTGPIPLTPDVGTTSRRYADGRVTPIGRWLIAVEELHEGADLGTAWWRSRRRLRKGRGPRRPARTSSRRHGPPRTDRWLAWLAWDHPSMPWDRSELWVAVDRRERRGVALGSTVTGGRGVRTIGRPTALVSGRGPGLRRRPQWLVVAEPADRRTSRTLSSWSDLEAEFHAPDWVLGQATMAELSDGISVVAAAPGRTRWCGSLPAPPERTARGGR